MIDKLSLDPILAPVHFHHPSHSRFIQFLTPFSKIKMTSITLLSWNNFVSVHLQVYTTLMIFNDNSKV